MSEPVHVEPVAARPQGCTDLFAAFTRLALQGFGGVLPVAQRELVERLGWLTREQFLESLSIAQVLPGPNVVNLSLMIGDRFFGWRGAASAMAGMLLLPLAVVLLLAVLAAQAAATASLLWVAGALRGMAVVAAALVLATAIKLLPALRKNALGLPLALAFGGTTLVAVGVLRWPLMAVVLGLGPLSMACAWWRLARAADDARNGQAAP
jgi:chromate transporter